MFLTWSMWQGMWTKRRGIQPGDMSKYRGSATMVDEPTLQKPEGPPLDARVETRMIESDTLEKAHQFTKVQFNNVVIRGMIALTWQWLQPARPPADASLNSHISDVGLDGCATGLCSCWFVMRSVSGCLRYGQGMGCKRNLDKAFEWFCFMDPRIL